MNNKSPKIVSILIVLSFFGCSADGYRKDVMDPDLIEFFGGLDLGITRRQMKKIEPGLSLYGSDFSSYCGRSKNNPILILDLAFYDEYLIGTLIGTAQNEDIHASFCEDYIDAGGETSFKYWTDYFQDLLGKKPIHYFYNDESSELKVDIYLWHLGNYNFEIRKFVREPDIDTGFFVYFDQDNVPNLTTVRNLYIINQKGDTLKVARSRAHVTN